MTRRKHSTAVSAVALSAALLLSLGGCDSLLDTEDPDIIIPEDLGTIQGAEAMYSGAITDFSQGKDGSWSPFDGGYIGMVGLFSDEFRFGGTPPAVREADLRQIIKGNGFWDDTYRNLHQARESAERAARALTDLVADPSADSRIGEVYALSGFTFIFFGEGYCAGVPFGTVEPDVTEGTPLTTAEIFQQAITRFDQADMHAAGDANIENLSMVGRGRALVGLGQFDAAATAVAGVPTEYQYFTYHSIATERQVNWQYGANWELDYISVSDFEGTNGLDFVSANDPRVPTLDAGISRFDGKTPMFRFTTIDSRAAPVLTASGYEARMIEAEAQLQAGNFTGAGSWLDILNTARAFDLGLGLAALTDPGTQVGREDLMFRERAFWMFSQGHRLGDLRRLVRQYGRDAESVFPTGPYHKDNLIRGTDVNFIIPIAEENNPNFTACLDRNP